MPTSAATDRGDGLVVAGEQDRAQAERRAAGAIASAEVGLTASATDERPRGPRRPSRPRPRSARRPRRGAAASSSSAGSGCDQSASSCGRPTTTACPSTIPARRGPRRWRSPRRRGSVAEPSRGAARRWPAAIGCSEASSSAPASRSTSSASSPAAATTSSSVIWPVVTVPVLSSTTVSTRRVDSSTSGPLIRMPSWAPRPVPTISAVGVARPSAHGQAMISTATAAVNAAAAPAPVPSQKPERGRPRARSRPARRRRRSGRPGAAPAALPFCASSTRRAIWASWVSAPTRVARTTSRPPALTVAPTTASPAPTSTGTDSPVSIEASTADAPSSTTPSVAIFSPGRTTNRSPTASCVDRDPHLDAVAQDGDVLGAELQQRPQRGPGPPLGPGLEVAAGQDERGHAGGGLEVDVAGAVGRARWSARTGASCPACRRCRRTARRATSRRRPACRARSSVSIVAAPWRRLVQAARWNGQRAPDHDRRGQGQREPLPVGRTAAPGPSPARRPGRVSTGGDEQPVRAASASGRSASAAASSAAGGRAAPRCSRPARRRRSARRC